MEVFFSSQDYDSYRNLLREQTEKHGVEIWAYCLMPNHVHLIAVPASRDALARALGEAHRKHAIKVNRRFGWKGHLWQERFASFPMDEPHLLAAVRYVLLNPVRAGLVAKASDWPFSSLACHRRGKDDPLVTVSPLHERIDGWDLLLDETPEPEAMTDDLRRHSRTGRPLGDDAFIDRLESYVGRSLRPWPGKQREDKVGQ
jgi:putative transposase